MTTTKTAPETSAEADGLLVSFVADHREELLTDEDTIPETADLRAQVRSLANETDWFESLSLLQTAELLPVSSLEKPPSPDESSVSATKSLVHQRIVDRVVTLIESGNTPLTPQPEG